MFGGTITVSVKAGLARLHLQSAERFSAQCESIATSEAALPWPQPHWDDSRSLVSAAVILSVAALEATANEFYLEAVDGNTETMQRLGERGRRMLATMWEDVDEHSILHKYELALACCEVPAFNRGEGAYQAAASLIDLRNALVHFKPEWDHSLDQHAKLQKRLAGRFQNCALASRAEGRMLWFPNLCLSAGCATWAVSTVRAFIVDFCERLKIQVRC
jgi:hypothetical protein